MVVGRKLEDISSSLLEANNCEVSCHKSSILHELDRYAEAEKYASFSMKLHFSSFRSPRLAGGFVCAGRPGQARGQTEHSGGKNRIPRPIHPMPLEDDTTHGDGSPSRGSGLSLI